MRDGVLVVVLGPVVVDGLGQRDPLVGEALEPALVLRPLRGAARQPVVAHQLVDRLQALAEDPVGVLLGLRRELLRERLLLGHEPARLLVGLVGVLEALVERVEPVVDRPVVLDLAQGGAAQRRGRVGVRAGVRRRPVALDPLGAHEVDRVARAREPRELGAGRAGRERRLDLRVALVERRRVELADLVDLPGQLAVVARGRVGERGRGGLPAQHPAGDAPVAVGALELEDPDGGACRRLLRRCAGPARERLQLARHSHRLAPGRPQPQSGRHPEICARKIGSLRAQTGERTPCARTWPGR